MLQSNIILNQFKDLGANGQIGAHLFKKELNNACALTNEYKNDNQELDLSQAINNIMGAVAKFGYMPGSDIGIIIHVTCVCYVLKDRELNKQFLNADGTVDLFKLGAIFPFVGTAGNECGYNAVFSAEECIEILDKTGRIHNVMAAYKPRIKVFTDSIACFGGGTADDLVRMGKDLEVTSTVISELEIDAAKDDSKREGMIAIEDFMNTRNLKQRSRTLGFTNNFKDIVNYKKGYIAEAHTKLEYGFNEVKTMFEFDEYYNFKREEFIKGLKESGEYNEMAKEEIQKELRKLKLQVRNECVIIDPLFEVVQVMMEAVRPTLQQLTTFYVNSDMELFKNFCILPQRNEEYNWRPNETLDEAIFAVRKTAVIVYEMLNNTYAYNKLIAMMKPEDLAKIGRDVIYNAGAVRGFTPHDTFLIGVDAGWYRRVNGKLKDTKNTGREKFSYAAVEAVFGTELKYYLNPEAMKKVADLEIPQEVLESGIFAPGLAFGFKDGQCSVEVDGEEHTIIRVDDVEYTGYLLLSVDDEGNAEFIEDVNQYAFNEVDYAIFDSIANVTAPENSISPEDFEALLVNAQSTDFVMAKAYRNSKLVLKTTSEKPGVKFLTEEEKAREAERVAPLLGYWENIMKLEYEKGLASGMTQKHYHLSDGTGKGRILGSVHDSFLEIDKEYNNIFAIATPVGAIMVKSIKA